MDSLKKELAYEKLPDSNRVLYNNSIYKLTGEWAINSDGLMRFSLVSWKYIISGLFSVVTVDVYVWAEEDDIFFVHKCGES